MSARWSGLLLWFAACDGSRDEACWVADRAADRVILLDDELLPVTSIAIDSPALVAVDERALWIAHGHGGAGQRPFHLSRLTHELALHGVRDFDAIRDLCAHPNGGVAVLEERSSGDGVLWRVEATGTARADLELAGLALVVADREHLLVALEDGGLVLLRGDGAVLGWTRLEGAARALCAGHLASTWWVLWGERDRRLSCFGPGFTRLAELPAPESASHIALARDGIWVAGSGGASLLELEGGLRQQREDLAPGDEPAGIATAGPDALWLLPGAVVRSHVLGRELRVRASQGGFEALTDLASTQRCAWSAPSYSSSADSSTTSSLPSSVRRMRSMLAMKASAEFAMSGR